MNGSKMKGYKSAAVEDLFREYFAFYEERWLRGNLSACNEAATKEKAKEILTLEPGLGQEMGGLTLYDLIASCLDRRHSDPAGSIQHLMDALEFLELVCVNLALSPWRKEIKSLKTFTGNFVYRVQSVLPETILKGILQKIGYTKKTATEFLVTEKINETESQGFAFQMFLARIECELILELTNGGETCSCLNILKKRAEIPGNHDEGKDREIQADLKDEPLTLFHADKPKTTTCPVSKPSSPSKDGLSVGVRNSKGKDHLESAEDGVMNIIGMQHSEPSPDKADRKGRCSAEPSADSSSKGSCISDSHEGMRNCQTNSSENIKTESNGLIPSKLSITIKFENKVLNPSNLAENLNMGNKALNPSPEKIKDNKGLIPSQLVEDAKMDTKEVYTLKSKEARDMDSKGSGHSESAEDHRLNIRGSSHSNSEKRSDRNGTDYSESTAYEVNKQGTHHSSSKSHAVDSAIESKDQSLDSKSQATESFLSKRSESEEFLTQYSDINIAQRPIAQKPIFQDEYLHKNKKLKAKKNLSGLEATVLEEATTDEPSHLKVHESGPESFAVCTEAKAESGRPTNKAGSNVTKEENDPSFCNITGDEHDVSRDDASDLALSFSNLTISETVDKQLAYPIEKTTNDKSESFRNCTTVNNKEECPVQMEYSNPACDCGGQHNVAQDEPVSLRAFSEISESTDYATSESNSRPRLDRLAVGRVSENFTQVREPPGSTYIPPKSQSVDEHFVTMYFQIPPSKNEQQPSTNTSQPHDSILQLKEDIKDDFVLISHQMAQQD